MNPLLQIKRSTTLDQLTPDQIKALQTALRSNGFPTITVDGILGNQTRSMFRDFKTINQLTHIDLIGETTVHWLLDNDPTEADNDEDEPLIEPYLDKLEKKRPYDVGTINWNDFNCPISKYFTVGEMTRFSRERIPTNLIHRRNLVTLAHQVDLAREEIGVPFLVTSAYRPPAVNSRVGGVSNSQHLYGTAVDIYSPQMPISMLQKLLDANWYGRLGRGVPKGFVHLDMANGKGWRSGGTKGVRWNY